MEDDPVQLWAKVKRAVNDARDEKLKSLGFTWDTLNKLEQEAALMMGTTETVLTPYGTVQRIPAKPVQFKLRKIANDADPFPEKQLKLLQPKEA